MQRSLTSLCNVFRQRKTDSPPRTQSTQRNLKTSARSLPCPRSGAFSFNMRWPAVLHRYSRFRKGWRSGAQPARAER